MRRAIEFSISGSTSATIFDVTGNVAGIAEPSRDT
jgi:hypothetical protein